VTGAAPRFRVLPGGSLQGAFRVPGDKSVSHRFVMLGSLAEGVSEAEGFLEGQDAMATVAAFRAMGVRIEGPQGGRLRIQGAGLYGLSAPACALDMGNSGTAMRLLCGLLCAQRFTSRLVGDASLSRRPMRRVTEPLSRMGARISAAEGGTPPLDIRPAPGRLTGIDYPMPVASAQVKSALLLAGLYADGVVTVHEPAPTRDHTERMLASFGQPVRVEGARVSLSAAGRLSAQQVVVPGDISSAAFFLVGASIAPGASLRLTGVGLNPTRTGVLDVLRMMGADITVSAERTEGGEPVGDLHVRHAPLAGVRIPTQAVPRAIDELPALMVAAACAEGVTELTGAAELRVKESDRIAAVAAGLRALGIEVEEREDGMRVRGGRLAAGVVDSLGDHRIAMAFAIAGLAATGPVEVLDCANVDTSFPGFAALAASAGLRIEVV
jgi:3-phosphoshikimate 1-carboxyvinyltransferase